MLITHRCSSCNRPDYWADEQGQRATAGDRVGGQPVPADQQRRCCRPDGRWGPPETAPRWLALTGEPVTDVAKPGSQPFGPSAPSRTCNCDDCQTLYRQLTAKPGKKPRRLAAVPT